jgi:hypothetical protein
MSILWTNNANSTVSGSLSSTGTTVSVASGSGSLFPTIVNVGTDYFMLTFYDQLTKTVTEICKCTAHASGSDNFTIVRSQENTTARAWNSGDIILNAITAGTLAAFVQSGAGPLSTSMIYVGADTSITPGTLVVATTPIPSSLAVGMQFNIKVNNTNPGPVTLQLNGAAGVPVTRQDGSPMVGGNLVSSEEMIFVCSAIGASASFTAMVPPIPAAPPQTTFYVNPAGNDTNSGFANTAAAAFRTISGGMYNIKQRYISQNTITIRVADGTYVDCVGDIGSYIASWNIVGNAANPGNCVIDSTSSSQAAYPPHAMTNGSCCVAYSSSNITIQGFTFKSYYDNCASSGGYLTIQGCNFTAPVAPGGGTAIVGDAAGILLIYGACLYTGAVPCQSIIAAGENSYVRLGDHNIFYNNTCTINIQGTPTVSLGTVEAVSGGTFIHLDNGCASFTGGTPVGPKYYVSSTGGIVTEKGDPNTAIPGSQPGIIIQPGYAV